LKEGVTYKELGAEYLDSKTKKRRESYLKQELEKLGYDVSLTLSSEDTIAGNAKETSLADAASTLTKEGCEMDVKTVKAAKTVKATNVFKTIKTAKAVKTAGKVRATG
jgi:hypothetical protein